LLLLVQWSEPGPLGQWSHWIAGQEDLAMFGGLAGLGKQVLLAICGESGATLVPADGGAVVALTVMQIQDQTIRQANDQGQDDSQTVRLIVSTTATIVLRRDVIAWRGNEYVATRADRRRDGTVELDLSRRTRPRMSRQNYERGG
jgi:hypothetical protein